jgi:argininosuccinate synthase
MPSHLFGFWYSPEREMLQARSTRARTYRHGAAEAYKGNTTVVGRKSPKSLYSMQHVTFEDDEGAYNQRDAEGFIKLNALRLRLRGLGQGGPKS